MGRTRRTTAVTGWLLVLALISTACGSRLSHGQQLQADRLYGSGRTAIAGAADGGNSGAPGDDTAALGDAPGPAAAAAIGTGGAGGGGRAGGSSAAGGTAGAGAGPNSATTLPAGGNGGATDVGVTADSIVLGDVSTLTGPVPG